VRQCGEHRLAESALGPVVLDDGVGVASRGRDGGVVDRLIE
jgi:hypothetical protein